MKLTDKLKTTILQLSIEEKVEILHIFADEFMTVEEFHQLSKIPKRTIYEKFGTDAVKGTEFCGHKLIHL